MNERIKIEMYKKLREYRSRFMYIWKISLWLIYYYKWVLIIDYLIYVLGFIGYLLGKNNEVRFLY